MLMFNTFLLLIIIALLFRINYKLGPMKIRDRTAEAVAQAIERDRQHRESKEE